MTRRPLVLQVAAIAAAAAIALPMSGFPRSARRIDRSALWTRVQRPLLHGFQNMYNLHVIEEPGAPYRYRAWFFGWAVQDCNRNVPGMSGCDAIFAARARTLDGPWQVYADGGRWDAAMSPATWRPVVMAQRQPYDEWHNGDPSVVRRGGRYYLAYSATGNNLDHRPYGDPGDRDGSILCVMGAVSDDGLTWRKSAAPLLLNRKDLGSPPVPQGDAHLYGSYHRPSLMWDRGRWRLWFDYWTPQGLAMGCAENRGDFLRAADWKLVRAGDRPCLTEWPNPDVVRVGNLYYAYADPSGYAEHPWIGRKLAEAVSPDGLDWVVLGFMEPDADAPANHVPEALVQRDGAGWRIELFSATQRGGPSPGGRGEPYDYRYDRIRRMWRTVTPATLRGDLARWRQLFATPRQRPSPKGATR